VSADANLAFRVAEYVRGALAIQNGPTIGEIETETRRAWFTVDAKDGKSVRVTVDDTTAELS
jgi:hypothetical protein